MHHIKRWLSAPGSWVILWGVVLLIGLGGCQGQRGAQVNATPVASRQAEPLAATVLPAPTSVVPDAQSAPPAAASAAPAAAGAPTVSAAAVVTATASAVPPAVTAPQTPGVGPVVAVTPLAEATPVGAPLAEASPAAAQPALAPSLPVRVVVDLPGRKLDAPVVEMGWKVIQTADGPRSDWVIPKNEAGHHMNSALLGEPGNLVISGHNNIYGQVFRPLSLAWDNDTRIKIDNYTDESKALDGRSLQLIDASGRQFNYVVTGFYRLKDTGVSAQQRLANARYMQPTEETRVTLITCWPPSSNTHRLVLVASPAD